MVFGYGRQNEALVVQDPLQRIERAVRDLIHDVLSQRFGPAWTDDPNVGLGRDWSDRLAETARHEAGAQRERIIYEIPLACAEFRDLLSLLEKHSRLFEPVSPDWPALTVYMHDAERLRNTVKHHRDITDAQASLLHGISGQIEDWIALWRVGSPMRAIESAAQFVAEVALTGVEQPAALNLLATEAQGWKEDFLRATDADAANPRSVELTESATASLPASVKLRFASKVRKRRTPIRTSATLTTTVITLQITVKSGSKLTLSDLVAKLGKPYWHIKYSLEQPLNLVALQGWARDQAGLDPSGSVTANGQHGSVDFRLLGGRLSVSAGLQRSARDPDRRLGTLSLTAVRQDLEFWQADRFLGPRTLVGFMVGSIAPRAIMHLVNLACMPPTRVSYSTTAE